MADFGVAGKRTVRVYKGAVIVRFSQGEFLSFRLTAQGAEPIFTFACMHHALRSEHQFEGHPKQVYEWNWGRNPGQEIDADDDMYGVAMSFITAIKYTLLVEHRQQNGGLIKVLKDIDYESQAPQDNFTETLEVLAS
jgi:hypothetical protein